MATRNPQPGRQRPTTRQRIGRAAPYIVCTIAAALVIQPLQSTGTVKNCILAIFAIVVGAVNAVMSGIMLSNRNNR